MATSRQISTYEVGPDGETIEEGIDADQLKSFDEFRAAVAGSDNELQVWCFKCPTDKSGEVLTRGRLAHMFTCPIDKWNMDEMVQNVRDNWMGEDTRWTIRVQVREAGSRIRWNKLVEVLKAGNSASANNAKTRSELVELMQQFRQTLEESERRFNERLAQMRTQHPQESFGMREMMQMFQAAQTQAQAQKNQEMQTLAMLLAALKPTTSGTQDIMTLVKSMGEIKNFASDLLPSGSTDNDSPIAVMKAASPYVELLGKLMDQKKNEVKAPALPAPTPTAAPQPAAPPVTPPQPAVTPNPNVENESKRTMIAELREQLKALAEIAPSNPPAKEVVATLLPMLPEEMDDMIFETLSSENWFTRLTFIQPAIKPYETWFTDVRNEILAAFKTIENPPS